MNLASIHTVDQLVASIDDVQKMGLLFGLSTNLRGLNTFIVLQQFLKPHFKRYLDVGCGYGGFVNAFARQGYDAYGLEIDPQLFLFSRLNTEGSGTKSQIYQNDFVNDDLSYLGTFDVITCNDVIEHVQNPEVALNRLAQLLNPGGVRYMEIPNKDALSFVEADGHFKIFGINLLDHFAAAQYYSELKDMEGRPELHYAGMGEFYPLGYYLNRLEARGLSTHLISNFQQPGADLDRVPMMLAKLSLKYASWYQQREQHSHFVSERLIEAFSRYMGGLYQDFEKARYHGEMKAFIQKYLI